MRPLPPRLRRWLPNLGLGLASLLLAALLAEAAVRWLRPQPLDPVSPGLYERQPPGGYRLRPGHRGTFGNLTEFATRLEINAHGLRGGEVAAKAPGEARLLVLGDSFAFGWGVEAAEAFPARLEERLAGELPGVTVLNGGVPGYGLPDEVDWLERWGPGLSPDAVLVAVFLGNDLLDATAEHRGVKLAGGFVEGGGERGAPAWLHRHCHLLRLAKRAVPLGLQVRLRSLLALPPPWELAYLRRGMAIYALESPELAREGRAATRRAFDRLLALAADRSFRLALALVPDRLQVDPERWRATLTRLGLDADGVNPGVPGRFYRQLAAERGVPILDLTPVFREALAEGRTLYYRHDPHWTPGGHRLAAEALAPLAAGLLTPRAAPPPAAR